MNADCYYTIGRGHQVCQDYALAGSLTEGLNLEIDGLVPVYAVVSDGCSSSHDTDWGSRFYCRAFRNVFEDVLLESTPEILLSGAILMEATRMANAARLPNTVLDATLMYSYVQQGVCRVKVHGDGVVFARRRNGSRVFSTIQFHHGAPAYLSYLLEDDRQRLYLRETNAGARDVTTYDSDILDFSDQERPQKVLVQGLEPTEFKFAVDEFDVVGMLSDGAMSFSSEKGPVAVSEIVDEVLDLKGFAGEFAVRRCKRFLRAQAQSAGWHHEDDFSAAMIYLGELPR